MMFHFPLCTTFPAAPVSNPENVYYGALPIAFAPRVVINHVNHREQTYTDAAVLHIVMWNLADDGSGKLSRFEGISLG